MADRKARLKAYVEENGGTNAVARRLGYANASFLSQMLGPKAIRDVSEKTVRRYERKLGLPTGYFDRDQPITADVVRLVGKVLEDEGVSLPMMKLSDLIAIALADAAEHGGVARPALLQAIARLLK